MAISYRKLLLEDYCYVGEDKCVSTSNETRYCPTICVSECPEICLPYPSIYSSPPETNQNQPISPFVIIIIAILGGTFLLVSYYAIIMKYCSSWRNSRRRSPPQQLDDTHDDFIDENHGPVTINDHPIWFITTVGLQESVINSITVCKYKKGEGLIEGTDCSVCLSEFEEDETLRLLPKCSHAFHLPCIDTWLRSHKNCPLCRAPVVVNASGSTVTATERNLNNLGSEGETLDENPQRENESGIDQIRAETEDEGELGVNDGRRVIDIGKEIVSFPHAINELRVLSDLANNGRVVEDDIQPMRRSVSMDSFSASMICFSLATFLPEESGGSSRKVRVKKVKGSGNPAISKLMGSSSMRQSLQKGPISMKRSLSSGGKFLFRNSRNSILPL